MHTTHHLNKYLEESPVDPYNDDNISLALMNRLKARIARRESRFKTRVVERIEPQADPPIRPAA